MSENTKSLITWLIVLVMVVAMGSVLFFSMPDFASVERVAYTENTTIVTTLTTHGTTFSQSTTVVKEVEKTEQTVTDNPTAETNKTTIQPIVFPLNINTATAEELMCVKGIGEVYAARIIEYRDKIGGYTSLDQLLHIKGIGEKRLAQWSEYLTVA